MTIDWYYRGQKMIKLANMTNVIIPKYQRDVDWRIRVILETPWVKKDDHSRLRTNKRISMQGC